MRVFLIATLLGIGMLAAVNPSQAQVYNPYARNGVYIEPYNRNYVPHQSYPSYNVTPSYQYGASNYYYNTPATTYSWNGGWNYGTHYHPPVYHRGYWHNGHYHPGHWHSGQWHSGHR